MEDAPSASPLEMAQSLKKIAAWVRDGDRTADELNEFMRSAGDSFAVPLQMLVHDRLWIRNLAETRRAHDEMAFDHALREIRELPEVGP